MRILVVGPTGPLGRRLVNELAGAGHELVLCARRPERLQSTGASEPDVREVDVHDRAGLRAAADGCEACFHLVAWTGEGFAVSDRQAAELFRVNVDGTRNVADACREAGVKRLVYTSTHLTGRPLPLDRLTPYLTSRLLAESEVFRAGARGLHTLVLAPAWVVGIERGPFTQLLEDLAASRIPVFPEDTRVPLVGLEDVVAAHLAALERGEAGGRYLLQAAALTWRQLADLVGVATGWPVVLRAVGARTAALAARVDAALLSRLQRRDPVARPERLWALTHETADDPAEAADVLGFRYGDLETGLRRFLQELVETRRIGGD